MSIFCPGDGRKSVSEIGGKAANLDVLMSLGLTVPRWFAITTSAFKAAMKTAGLDSRIADRLAAASDEATNEALQDIRSWITDVEIPADLTAAITEQCDRMLASAKYVSVRSSAADEDNPQQSFAGIHDSFLYVSGPDAILDAVRKVWASAYNERAFAYRKENDLPTDNISVAVIIQEMVDASASGVVFTANPVSGNVKELVISSVYGSGEGLVSAGLDADTFTVTKQDLSVDKQISEKPEMMVLDAAKGSGITKKPVDSAKQTEPSLSDAQVTSLSKAAMQIEISYGIPQDIEFSFDAAGSLYILQSRPVTTVEEYGPAAGNHLIWDNSNIIESYSGVTSPMTFSFIRRAYTIVYNCFCDVMGVPKKLIAANQGTFSNMLGLFRGQVYYNLLNWYRLIRLFPGFSYNKEFMESMMGVQEPAELKDEYKTPGFFARYFVELPRLLRLIIRSAVNFRRIRKLVAKFDAHFSEHYERWEAMDFAAKKPHELVEIYQDMEKKLLWEWKAPIINDFFVMIFYGSLKKLCASWCGDADGTLQNDLICGEGGIESTQPTHMLMRMAAVAKKDPTLSKVILDSKSEDLLESVLGSDSYGEFNEMFRSYIHKYGFRCMNELKLEEPSLKDSPAFVFTILRNYLQMDDPSALDLDAMAEREQTIRRSAEEKAFGAIRSRLKLSTFRWVLGNARLGVKNRENMRFARTKIYGLLRDLLRALGGHLAKDGILEEADDIFYLTLDECFDFIKGTAVTTNLSALAALRKEEFGAYREQADKMPDDRFDTYGMAYNRNAFRSMEAAQVTPEDGVLRGVGCCPGKVTGNVVVYRQPEADMRLAGEILVAERTDPGWVPLYPSAAAVLIERGSILSHSAIVAREMGIPTIVGIPGLTSVLKTGDQVTMDGGQGTVVINQEPSSAEDRPTEA